MFALGIFASPLPYAAVIAFYSVYLFMVHVNDAYDKQQHVDDTGKHIEYEAKHQPQATTTYFADIVSPDQEKAKSLQNQSLAPPVISNFGDGVRLKRPFLPAHTLSHLFNGLIIARPPPVV